MKLRKLNVVDTRKKHKPNVTASKKLKTLKKQPGKTFVDLKKKPTKKTEPVPTAPKPRKPRQQTPPARSFAAWVVYDKTGKRVETFPYRDKWAAEKCVKKKGDGHYMNLLKESEGK